MKMNYLKYLKKQTKDPIINDHLLRCSLNEP